MKIKETPTTITVDLKSVRLPGFVWILVAGLIMYLAHTYISDSGLVEVIGMGVYMLLKYVEVQYNRGELDTVESWIKRAHTEIMGWRSISRPPTDMRASTPAQPPLTMEVKTPSRTFSWLFD